MSRGLVIGSAAIIGVATLAGAWLWWRYGAAVVLESIVRFCFG
ncbi:MAG: hypothetical protein ABWZ41_06780 [Burkholderiales bacterium]|jgi:hypothetical protein